MENGASMVGFAMIDKLYNNVYLNGARSEDSVTESIEIPHYPFGISIILALPREVIKNISNAPTMDAYPQTVSATKEYGIFRTVMPHKTVAVHAGLGWIGKSALFISEKYGSAVRLTSVLTDAPLEYNKLFIHSKCGNCMLCTSACPGKAISGQLWRPELDRDEIFDAMACRKKAREIAAESIDKEITLCGKCRIFKII